MPLAGNEKSLLKYFFPRFMKDFGPWVEDVFKYFTVGDLDKTDFGPKHCQVMKDGNLNEPGDSVIKVVYDGEVIITAIFTLSSLHNFYHRFGKDSIWQDRILMLEKFTITHIMDKDEYGEIAIRVEKFCCIVGEPKYTIDNFPFPLIWANSLSVVRQSCKEIWENKLLDEVDGTLEFDNTILCNSDSITSMGSTPFLPGINSARGILIAPFEERQILNSLPGWSKESKTTLMKNHPQLVAEIENNNVNHKKLCINKLYSKNQEKKNNYIAKKKRVAKDISSKCSQINRAVSKRKIEDNITSSIPNKVCISCIGNSNYNSIALFSQSKNNCAYSLIKESFEKEEQRLLELQQNSYFSSCFWIDVNSCMFNNTNLASLSMLKQQCDFSLILNQNEEDSPTGCLYKTECSKLNNNINSITSNFLQKKNFNKIDSLLNFSQKEVSGNFCYINSEKFKRMHHTSNELFHIPIQLKISRKNFFRSKHYFNENANSSFSDPGKSINCLTLHSDDKYDDGTKDNYTSRKDTRSIVYILDHFFSKINESSVINKEPSTSFNSVKRLKCSPIFKETCFLGFSFAKDISLGNDEDRIKKNNNLEDRIRIKNDQTSDISFIRFPDARANGSVSDLVSICTEVTFPYGNSKIVVEPKMPKSAGCQKRKAVSLNKPEFSRTPQNFQWVFSDVHIDAMWIKFVELLLERPKQTENNDNIYIRKPK